MRHQEQPLPLLTKHNLDGEEATAASEIPAAKAESESGLGRRLAAGFLIAGVALGAASCKVPDARLGHIGTGPSASAGETSYQTKPVVQELPLSISSDFKAALAVDTCNTKVTPEAVGSVYRRLFLTKQLEPSAVPELKKKVEQTTTELRAERQKQGALALPESFPTLAADAYGKRSVPLNVYQVAASDFFGKLGIRTVFDWKKQNIGDPNYDMDQEVLARTADPVKETQLGANSIIRAAIVYGMITFANMPASVARLAKVQQIAFGADRRADEGGAAHAVTGTIVINSSLHPGNAYVTAPDIIQSVMAHEVGHHVRYQTCGIPVFGETVPDPAYDALGINFKHGQAAQQILNNGGSLPGGLSALGEASGKVVVESAYGAVNLDEDNATVLGQGGFNTQSVGEVNDHPNQDTKILKEKIALEITRATADNPVAVEYFGKLYDASQLRAQINGIVQDLNQKMYDRLVYAQTHGNGPAADGKDDSQFKQLQVEYNQYYELSKQLASGTSGFTH